MWKRRFDRLHAPCGKIGGIIVEIYMDCGQFIIGEYSIAGNYEDGYTVWRTEDGEDSETLFENISFENCVVWCLNS